MSSVKKSRGAAETFSRAHIRGIVTGPTDPRYWLI
jgi:hypothetical protein